MGESSVRKDIKKAISGKEDARGGFEKSLDYAPAAGALVGGLAGLGILGRRGDAFQKIAGTTIGGLVGAANGYTYQKSMQQRSPVGKEARKPRK